MLFSHRLVCLLTWGHLSDYFSRKKYDLTVLSEWKCVCKRETSGENISILKAAWELSFRPTEKCFTILPLAIIPGKTCHITNVAQWNGFSATVIYKFINYSKKFCFAAFLNMVQNIFKKYSWKMCNVLSFALILCITCTKNKDLHAPSPPFFLAYLCCSPTVIVWFCLNPSVPKGTALSIEKLMLYKKWKEHRKVS